MTTKSSKEVQGGISNLRLKFKEHKSDKLRLVDLEQELERTLYDLSVHQEELSTQNEELVLSREKLETLYNKYSVLFEDSPVGYMVFDNKQRILETNQAAVELFNISKEQLINRRILPYIDGSEIRRFQEHLHRVFDGDQAIDEIQIIPKNGPSVPTIFQSHQITDTSSGKQVSLTVIFDISERKRNEKQIATLAEQNRRILNATGDGIIGIDKKGVVVFSNPAAEKMLKWSGNALLGNHTEKLLQPQNQDGVPINKDEFAIQLTLQDGEVRSASDCSFCRRDDSRFQVEYNISPTFDESGISGLVLTFSDITERKQNQEALQEAHELLEERVKERTKELRVVNERLNLTAQVFECTAEAIVITDSTNKIVEVNPAFSRITGYSLIEAIGRDPGFMKSDRHDREFYSIMWRKIWKDGFWQGEIWDRRKNGEIYPKWLSINTVKNDSGELINCIGVFSDISIVKSAEEKLEKLAFFDPLTALPNRSLFKTRLEHEFTAAQRHNTKVALLFLDLDNFKNVNDTLGHSAGDQLLVVMADRIKSCVRESDTVSRLGGDEFTVILTGLEDEKAISPVADNILRALKQPVNLNEHQVMVGCSIGIAIYPTDGDSSDVLIRNADASMYHAKAMGRNSYAFFTENLNEQALTRLEIENGLRKALSDKLFTLHYQPKIDFISGTVVGLEALIRWERPGIGLVSPAEFIPVAEESGMIKEIGQFVLERACEHMMDLVKEGISPLTVAVNLSIRQLKQSDLIANLANVLEKTKLPPSQLELEITESMLAEDVREAIVLLSEIRQMGISIAVDDFGTGYSSLNYLKRFPINTLKIDRSFVKDLPDDSDDAAIVSAIISMAQSLGLNTVAEGVETLEQGEFISNLDCNNMQGFYFSKPLPIEELIIYLKNVEASNNSLLRLEKQA
ncbi:MAG: EAL domain-containing protein [Magnetococcales bacterium]|nr:EAL domain-containing protein [Magnetococcales bacterium]